MSETQKPTQPTADISSLRSITWKRFLRAPDAQLVEDLYAPALSRALRYDRCCAYFSSSVLSAAARGFGGLIKNLLASEGAATKPAVRLLVNEQLDPPDMKALLATGDQSVLIAKLLKQFTTPQDALAKRRLAMLAWLVASGWLEVRVGLMRYTQGVAHAKFGIITDQHGDALAFMGSDNETGKALIENYEEMEVRPSWEDPAFADYYRARFDTLWEDRDEQVMTLPLPEAVKLKLIKLAPKEPPLEEPVLDRQALETTMLWHFIAVAPYLPHGEYASDATALVDLWPHQHRVVEDTACAFPAGRLLCDEVGMGKTIEAILVLRRLLAGRGVQRALLLPPAGLLRQWQDELREKGGLLIPRWEDGHLCPPNGERVKMDAAQALRENNVLLLSREWARLDNNREIVLSAPAWDLVLMDEAHAARRSSPEEGEFNAANLLLQLLRDFQLRKRTRGILLLSATPMQTQPWEPWDLLATLGVGGDWLVDFGYIRTYYGGVEALKRHELMLGDAATIARLVAGDGEFPPVPKGIASKDQKSLCDALTFASSTTQELCAAWLRAGAPLGRRMHRNTRDTLRQYYQMHLLETPPPSRDVRDEVFDFLDPAERHCYEAIDQYINKRYDELEREKPGKGFVMTIYRRRAASSPLAFRRSLQRRRKRLDEIIHQQCAVTWLRPEDEQVDPCDLGDADLGEQIDLGLPRMAQVAAAEKEEIGALLGNLDALGATDSKFAKFRDILNEISSDGRSVLVFTEYTDTMEYLRDQLYPTYGAMLGCFSGDGGLVWEEGQWQSVSKAEITQRLTRGALRILVCTDAASEGLNLQAASALINYDLPWNPSKVEQRIGRIDRIGQRQALLPIRNLFLIHSVDMAVYQALRQRCGLFTHFVGRMQPVLALARDALRGNLKPDQIDSLLGNIQDQSNRVQADVVVNNVFMASEVRQSAEVTPPATRADIEQALAGLKGGIGKVRAIPMKHQGQWRLTGFGKHAVEVSTQRDTLERNKNTLPLTPGSSDVMQRLVERLPLTGQVPLVLAEHVSGAFRCVEARWVQNTGTIQVESARQLKELCQSWDGTPPAPGAVVKAQAEAHKEAKKRVVQMQQAAQAAETAGLERQQEAARRRLMRELGRTLRCIRAGDLNAIFRQQVERESRPDGRYRRALQLLGGYPHWTADDVTDADHFVEGLVANERQARLALASELDAALNDPRWRAARAG